MQSQSSGQKKHSIDRKNGFVTIVSLHKIIKPKFGLKLHVLHLLLFSAVSDIVFLPLPCGSIMKNSIT